MTATIATGYGYNRTATLQAALRRLERLVAEGRMTAEEADRRAYNLIRKP